MHCDLASLTSVRQFVESLRCGWNPPQDTRHLQAHCLSHDQPVRDTPTRYLLNLLPCHAAPPSYLLITPEPCIPRLGQRHSTQDAEHAGRRGDH